MMKAVLNKYYYEFLLLIVAIIWGGGFIASKFAVSGLEPISILAYRFLGSALVLLLIFFKKIKNYTKIEMKAGALIGVVQLLAQLVLLIGFQYVAASRVSFLASTYVIFTPFLAFVLFKIKITTTNLIAAIIACFGVGLISFNGDLSFELTDLIILVFCFFFALQIVITNYYVKSVTSIFSFSFFQFFTAGILALIISLILRQPLIPTNLNSYFGIGYLLFFNTVIAYVLQNYAQRYVDETKTAIIMALESVFGFILSALILHDPLSIKVIIGGLIILISILIANNILVVRLPKPISRH